MHDTLALEDRGIPSVFLATVQFIDAADHQSRALGGRPASVFVEHPIQDRTDEEMRTIAEGVLDEVLDALVD